LNKSRFRRTIRLPLKFLGLRRRIGRENMAIAYKRRDALESGGEIRRSAARVGLSARETRRIVQSAEETPRDDVELVSALADALVERSLDHGWTSGAVSQLLDDVARVSGSKLHALALQVHSHATRNPSLLALSPPLALEMQVRMLAALAPIEDVSLWSHGDENGPRCVSFTNEAGPSRRSRVAARDVLRGRPPTLGLMRTVPVERWQQVQAVLVFRTPEADEEDALAAAAETALALTPILEREALLSRNASRERALVSSGERLLTRIGFDLHDGPIQDVAALAGDVRMLRGRVEAHPEAIPEEILSGFLEDLQSRIAAVDRGLRDVVHSLESPAIARCPLDEAVTREVDAFRLQSDIAVDLSFRGSFDSLTDSQRIALVRIVQESLSNARDHSGAQSITVDIKATDAHTRLEITDDGRGFDVSRTLVRAARRGRFGLLGMSERARLLGGRFDVQSSPGGPTVISVLLPVWKPVVPGAEQRSALVADEAPLV
jgi:signal transduction histidine kinase